MTDALAGMVLIVATLAVGLVAGIFGVSANPIMPGVGPDRRPDLRRFVQAVDRAAINPLLRARSSRSIPSSVLPRRRSGKGIRPGQKGAR